MQSLILYSDFNHELKKKCLIITAPGGIRVLLTVEGISKVGVGIVGVLIAPGLQLMVAYQTHLVTKSVYATCAEV